MHAYRSRPGQHVSRISSPDVSLLGELGLQDHSTGYHVTTRNWTPKVRFAATEHGKNSNRAPHRVSEVPVAQEPVVVTTIGVITKGEVQMAQEPVCCNHNNRGVGMQGLWKAATVRA